MKTHFRRVTWVALALSLMTVGASASADDDAPGALFEATAKFEQRLGALASGTESEKLLAGAYARIRVLRSQYLIGRAAIEQLITDLRLTEGLPHTADGKLTTDGMLAHAAMIQSIHQSISLKVEGDNPDLEIVTVTARHRDRDLAVRMANRLVENFVTKARTEADETLLDHRKFVEQEADRYRKKVDELDAARFRFRVSFAPLAKLSLDGKVPGPGDFIDIHGEFDRRQKQLAAARQRVERLK